MSARLPRPGRRPRPLSRALRGLASPTALLKRVPLVLLVLLGAAPAAADEQEHGAAPAVETRADAAGPRREAVPIAGTPLVRGRSEAVVNAPVEAVRAAVLGFAHYPEFMPAYSKCKVLGRSPSGGRDVFMEVTLLGGAVRLWARVDVPRPAFVDGFETYATRLLDGNVKAFDAVWRLRKLDAARTLLSLEIFLRPNLPMPASLLNVQNVQGAAEGVAAMRARVEPLPVARAPVVDRPRSPEPSSAAGEGANR